jgi:subtilase family serine protease
MIANFTVECVSSEYCLSNLAITCGEDCYYCPIEVLNSAIEHLYPDNTTLVTGTFTCGEHVSEFDNTTIAETNVWGTVSDNHTYTHEPDDNKYESITEISRQGTSLLEHKWTIDVIGGTKTNVTFHLKANRTRAGSTDSDDFKFEYSRDGSTYHSLVTVDTPEDKMYSCMMPNETSGNVTIRVMDTDREKRHKDLDTISIDHMFIRSVLGEPMPDLVITEKSETLDGGNFTVTYTVTNNGDADAGESNTTIYIDNDNVLEDPVPKLNESESYTHTVGPFECPCGETLNVTVCADNGNVVDESIENNNCMENELTCPGGELLPDLIITAIWCEAAKKPNTYYIYYNIKNIGSAEAGRSVSNWTIDGSTGTDRVGSLAIGQEKKEKITYESATAPPTTVTVCADYENLITESNDTNNCLTNSSCTPN